MKKLILLFVLTSLMSCTNEEPETCNCQVIGNDQFKEVIEDEGIQIIHSSQPIMIIPYDTITDCNQDQVDWYKVTTTIESNKTITKTSYRKIQCN